MAQRHRGSDPALGFTLRLKHVKIIRLEFATCQSQGDLIFGTLWERQASDSIPFFNQFTIRQRLEELGLWEILGQTTGLDRFPLAFLSTLDDSSLGIDLAVASPLSFSNRDGLWISALVVVGNASYCTRAPPLSLGYQALIQIR